MLLFKVIQVTKLRTLTTCLFPTFVVGKFLLLIKFLTLSLPRPVIFIRSSQSRESLLQNRNKSFVSGLKKDIDTLVKTTLSIFEDSGDDYYILAKIVLENINDNAKIASWQLNKKTITALFEEYSNNGELSIAPSKESFYKELLGCYNITGLDSKRFFTKDDKKHLYQKLPIEQYQVKENVQHAIKKISLTNLKLTTSRLGVKVEEHH